MSDPGTVVYVVYPGPTGRTSGNIVGFISGTGGRDDADLIWPVLRQFSRDELKSLLPGGFFEHYRFSGLKG